MEAIKTSAQKPQAARDWQFYLSPDAAWRAMHEDCAAATRSIEMEQYIFNNDQVGVAFMRLFIDKARQGVDVRLLCDEVGSSSMRHSPLIKELRDNGGVFHFFNSPKWIDIFKPQRLFPRTHMKALTIDDRIAYIGGVCFALRMKDWRDTHIRVQGAVVGQIKKALGRNRTEILDFSKKRRPFLPKRETIPDQDFTYVQSDPAFFRHPIYHALLASIGKATNTIYISAAFFIPPRRLRHDLERAARRGVEVIILIPMHSDSNLADWACLSYVPRLLRKKIRIFRYKPVILHTKTTVIDGTWGTVGSCNMDPLSFFHNREANLIVKDRNVLAEMQRDFFKDLKDSEELTRDMIKRIPLWKRAIARCARLLRTVL